MCCLSYRHGLPVHSVIVLLCPEADGPELTGVLHQESPDGRCRLEFHYQVVRVWELDVAELLAGGIGTLPLAPLAARSEDEMPVIVAGLMRRVDPGDTSADAREFWTTVAPAGGPALQVGVDQALVSRSHRHEGIVYVSGPARRGASRGGGEGASRGGGEGASRRARRILLLLGEDRFGPADAATRATLGDHGQPGAARALDGASPERVELGRAAGRNLNRAHFSAMPAAIDVVDRFKEVSCCFRASRTAAMADAPAFET